MSLTPSAASYVRLQELKLWQGSFDSLLQKSNSPSPNSLVENKSEHNVCVEEDHSKEWDKRKISPVKDFQQLLEEKLAEETPVQVHNGAKRPFLKKGEGLARFKMDNGRPPNNPRAKRLVGRKPVVAKPKASAAASKASAPSGIRGILKNPQSQPKEVDFIPLTVPEYVKPRASWKQVFQCAQKSEWKSSSEDPVGGSEEDGESVEEYEEFRRSLGSEESRVAKEAIGEEKVFKTSSAANVIREGFETPKISHLESNKFTLKVGDFTTINQNVLKQVNAYAKKYFDGSNVLYTNDIPDRISDLVTTKPPHSAGDYTLEEIKSERELKAFEILEKKVDNSSFCSTNTSVLNLLASTPRKPEKAIEGSIEEIQEVFPKDMQETIQTKLQEVAQKTDVLQHFLMNLRHMEGGGKTDDTTIDSDSTCQRRMSSSVDTSFSDENTRWSSRSPSFTTEETTELESTTYRHNSVRKVDAGVNTSFDENSRIDETIRNLEPCKHCEELRSKNSEAKTVLTALKCENTKIKQDLRRFEKEYDKFKKKMKKDGEEHREEVKKLMEELESERKKIAKERAYFESYVKECQPVRPSKKERDEMTQLKQELADAKELIKLKDAKNGATQARLRTQIKQQEKDIVEMKITIDKLQRENAKLSVQQKFARRPQEVKMLHEINKNLSKLTEETFKKQSNKTVSETNEKPSSGNKENAKEGTNDQNNDLKKDVPKPKSIRDSVRSNSTAEEPPKTTVDPGNIEKQYETMFGNISSPRNLSVSTNIEKTEKTLPDGSVEIGYSNGNVKTISADGNHIKMQYFNGDTKETDLKGQTIKYHYAANNAWHTQFADGTEVMEFNDGQRCTKNLDGKTEICYPDGSLKIINSDGSEEQQFPDGRKTIKNPLGEVMILLPNGQREIHTAEYKRREYPDGTIRTLHKDGTVETVYSNGRVRVKNANGVLIMDTHSS
ncbi:cingulin-like protein 1 isoform X1 [Anthonomus grandis grandis]|uniref:cingulin-like protein 1 isoform X1 n=1 Tax=Anthonomus grandis grandis TaxID=2921223 RepID=UPI002165D12A|nr:cingulin-like protein 1 isoform X1 [Anthonomus grandis grandis]